MFSYILIVLATWFAWSCFGPLAALLFAITALFIKFN